MPGSGKSGKRSARGRSGRWTTGWVGALVGSALVHTALLVVLAAVNRGGAVRPAEPIAVELATPPAALLADDGRAVDPAREPSDPPLPAEDELARVVPPPAPPGERDELAARTVAPRDADGRDRAAPAPDQGDDDGHRPERAYRHDRSTLRARLADTSDDAQPARLRTGRRSASPQAVRREARTGIGDAVATAEPSRRASAARPDAPPAPAGEGMGAAPGARAEARVDAHPEVTRVSDRPALDRGVGPLAAETGQRMFDSETRGRAADSENARAASNELHPGLTDFSHAGTAAPRDGRDGRGPGLAPGATPVATTGTAPSELGAPRPAELAADLARRARAREYDRYGQEIQRRVQRVLVFPKVLALRLEQGETVINFAVRPDGWVAEGPRIVKSSGFQEFDVEAVQAVLRAAPYPRRNDTYRVSMPVIFENPLIR
jgi:TonB family protein